MLGIGKVDDRGTGRGKGNSADGSLTRVIGAVVMLVPGNVLQEVMVISMLLKVMVLEMTKGIC